MEKLLNKKIELVNVFGDYHDGIQFKTDQGDVCFNAYGDCCSSSFFSDIWNASNVIGEVVTKVEDVELQPGEAPARKGVTKEDNEQIYGVRIYSKKGACTIIFRNHSNGYYGGAINESSSPVEGQEMWSIINDWSAPSL